MKIDYNYIWVSAIGIFLGLFTREIYNFIKNKLKFRMETTEISIRLEFKNVYENEKELLELPYSVLLVRYGKDEIKEHKELMNKMFKFEGRSNQKIAKLRVHKVLGAQFKCFVDYAVWYSHTAVDYKSEDQFSKIKNFLERNGFKEISHDDDKFKKRVWFIHPDYSICTTTDGYINNFVHPPSYRK